VYRVSTPLTVDSVLPLIASDRMRATMVDTHRIARLLRRARWGTASTIVQSLFAPPTADGRPR